MENTSLSMADHADLEPLATPLPPDRHPASAYLAGLGAGSRRTMAQALGSVAEALSGGRCDAYTCPWHLVRYQHAMALRAHLSELTSPRTGRKLAPATVNRHLHALRGVLKATWRLGYVSADDYHRTVAFKPAQGRRLPAGRELARRELSAVFRACSKDASAAGARDAALLSFMYAGGLRRSEVVGVDVGDYEPESGALRVRQGKGGNERLVYAPSGARLAADTWLSFRGTADGPFLCSVNKAGCVDQSLRRLTPQSAYDALARRARQAGVPSCSPHDLRRTFVSNLLDAGADLVTVQNLAGHASPTTTARYDRRGEETKRVAAELLQVPYRPSPVSERTVPE